MLNKCPSCKREVDVYTVDGKFKPYVCNCGYLVKQGETEVPKPEPVVEPPKEEVKLGVVEEVELSNSDIDLSLIDGEKLKSTPKKMTKSTKKKAK